MSGYCGTHGYYVPTTGGGCPQCKQPAVRSYVVEPPWQDIEIVVAAASVLFETIEDTAPEKDSAIVNVQTWLRTMGPPDTDREGAGQ